MRDFSTSPNVQKLRAVFESERISTVRDYPEGGGEKQRGDHSIKRGAREKWRSENVKLKVITCPGLTLPRGALKNENKVLLSPYESSEPKGNIRTSEIKKLIMKPEKVNPKPEILPEKQKEMSNSTRVPAMQDYRIKQGQKHVKRRGDQERAKSMSEDYEESDF